MAERNLFKLLDIANDSEEHIQRLDDNAIIKEVQENPSSVARKYCFDGSTRYPLLQAILLRAPFEVIFLLLRSFPDAVKEKDDDYDRLALHTACEEGASLDVISLLLESWPDAIKVKDTNDRTPLHAACDNGVQFDTISLLLRAWPAAVKEKDRYSQSPLYLACNRGALDVISLLLRIWPDAIKEKAQNGEIPLHAACKYSSSFNIISFLLKYYPDAIKMKNRLGLTPLRVAIIYRAPLDTISLLLNTWPGALNEMDRNNGTPFSAACISRRPLEVILLLLDAWLELPGNRNSDRVNSLTNDAPEDVTTLLLHVSTLFGHELSVTSQEELMSYFITIKWQKGALLVINKYPSDVKNMDLHTEVMADFLSLTGKYCSLATMWEVIINEQELLKGVKCL